MYFKLILLVPYDNYVNEHLFRTIGWQVYWLSTSMAAPCFTSILAFSLGSVVISSGLKGPYVFISAPMISGISWED